jgi:hypothetical protein
MRDGGGVCVICAGKSPEVAEAAFRARLAELGAEFLEDRWLGVDAPHLIRCPQGYLTRPAPTNVDQGHGLCRYCAGAEWDVLYVVTSDEAVKFGITSGDPRKRLRIHARHGFTHVKRLATELPGTIALDTETAIRSALTLAGEKPVRGREYYAIPCLALVLDVADSWLNEAGKPAA